ncbi:MAG: 3-deoxy-7-phosphoheptulonate synthase, partial [Duodenibacillus sp.]|nr:3-deoxy-7-phosphoheptulonate synthase [Duodenibacillus sp.]
LRGGGGRPNFDTVSVKLAQMALEKAGARTSIIVDCSHGNSLKNHELQPWVFADVIGQVLSGKSPVRGVMLESNINAGSQKIPEDLSQLKYGVSVTDACIGWETTEGMLLDAHRRLLAARAE